MNAPDETGFRRGHAWARRNQGAFILACVNKDERLLRCRFCQASIGTGSYRSGGQENWRQIGDRREDLANMAL